MRRIVVFNCRIRWFRSHRLDFPFQLFHRFQQLFQLLMVVMVRAEPVVQVEEDILQQDSRRLGG